MAKVAELEGARLDFWVAKAERKEVVRDQFGLLYAKKYWHSKEPTGWSPSRWWEQAGPIIERGRIELRPQSNGQWFAITLDAWDAYGPTPLIAAMRAYIASKFGEEVPDESV